MRELEKSPFLEQLLAKDYEVIYFTDPVDEYLMQNLLEFEDIKFQNASKDDLKLGDKDAKKENKKLKVGGGRSGYDVCSGFRSVVLLTVMAELPCSAPVGGQAACCIAHLSSRRGSCQQLDCAHDDDLGTALFCHSCVQLIRGSCATELTGETGLLVWWRAVGVQLRKAVTPMLCFCVCPGGAVWLPANQ